MDVLITMLIIAVTGLAFIVFALVLTRGGYREPSSGQGEHSERPAHSFSDSFWMWFDGNSGGSPDTIHHHTSHHGSSHHDAGASTGPHHTDIGGFGSHHGGFDGGGHAGGGGHH
jgi:hypothetical protein